MNEALAMAIHEAKARRGITIKDLARESGVSVAAVTRLLSGKSNSTLSTLLAVLPPLDVTLATIARQAEDISRRSSWLEADSSGDYRATSHGRTLDEFLGGRREIRA